MRNEILSGLEKIAKERNVKVLFACESGSRAWGTESDDSDYDVRFIYVSPVDTYVSLTESRDTIEVMDKDLNIDYVGWDLKKALNLLKKSNPSIIEWFDSPIQYVNEDWFRQEVSGIVMKSGGPNMKSLAYHYMGLLDRQYKAYWNKEEIPFKKYFYAIRPIFAIEFIDQWRKVPPINFAELTMSSFIPEYASAEFHELKRMKTITTEIDGKGRFDNLDNFITEKTSEMPEFIKKSLEDYSVPSMASSELDEFFRKVVLMGV